MIKLHLSSPNFIVILIIIAARREFFSSALKYTCKLKRVQHDFVPNLYPKLYDPFIPTACLKQLA